MQNDHKGTDEMFYTVDDVRRIMRLSKNLAYAHVQDAYKNQAPFPVMKIGTIYRIPKEKFDRYARGESDVSEK